ncbi:MAG: 2-dehydro-3-deoxy-phosphogluconate aldolase [Mesorhizobium sp.]|nr:2-dehydro-3-deoxy-phosphogluconate aldolase [Mesorhizobium sp.]MBL8578250.1 2-dehydro-3-deoxy-phosphogluconate aldolase [Mesorhizobium sp.]
MAGKTQKLLSLLDGQPVIPVIKIKDVEKAVPLARALAAGGLRMIEITLRTPDALEAIRRIAGEVEHAVVGAGTVLNPKQFDEAAAAGSKFIVSPGLTDSLVSAAANSEVPLLPGAITPSEIMTALEAGIDVLKFFPAEQAGGTTFLRSLASPLASVRFCPTGGISALNAEEYLAVPNVVCVGGSWVAPDDAIRDRKWDVIESLAREARALKPV